MTARLSFFIGTFLFGVTTALRAGPIVLESSELLLDDHGKLRQVVLAVVDPPAGATLLVTIGQDRQTFQTDKLSRFMGRLVIPVPRVQARQEIQVELAGSDLGGTIELEPVRPWEVFIVPHTHLDIGFTDLQERVWAMLADNLIGVIDLCEKTADWPAGSQFRWTIEGTALFENFARRYPQDRVDALVKLIRQGQVELTGYYANLLTELAGPESLLRAAYAGQRLSDRYHLKIDTVMLNDVPGYTWTLPQIWSQLGVRYANLRANGIRGKFVWHRPGAVPRPFLWQSPDGSQVVCWYTNSYREANFLRHAFPAEPGAADTPSLQRMVYQNIVGHLHRAAGTGYERDIIQLRMGGDNLTAVESVCHWVRHWNDRWAYPRLRIATSREFFQALADDARPLEVQTGDIPDWWADGAASSAGPTGNARIAYDQAVALETLSSLPAGPEPAVGPDVFANIHEQLLLYTEHTWGASGSWYGKDDNVVEQQWAVKSGYVTQASETLADVREQWTRAVNRWASPAQDGVIVWNPSAWPRTGLIELDAANCPASFTLRAPDDTPVPTQKSDSDTWCFVARDVPPVGYAFYAFDTSETKPTPPTPPLYEIEFDAALGAVRQIRHRPTGRQLIEASPRFTFNQYVYETFGQREKIMPSELKQPRSPEEKKVTPAEPAQLISHVNGPVFDRIVTRTQGPNAPAIEQTYTAFADLDQIDIRNRVEKIATEDMEGIHFAFPFALSSPQCRIEIPFTAMKPGIDQLKYSAADFYSIYHWVEFSDKTGGVLWSSIEAPVVVFGDLWPECWHDETRINNGLLFSYAMTNYWFTNYRRQQGGTLTFRYTIHTYEGQPDLVRSFRFGHESATPMTAQIVRGQGGKMARTQSWLSVSPDHVMLSAFKRADDGDGWIARLWEIGKGDCSTRLELPPGQWSVVATDITERGQRAVPVAKKAGTSVAEVPIKKGQIVTLRLKKMPSD